MSHRIQRTELNQTLSDVRKWVRFDNWRSEFGVSVPWNVGPKTVYVRGWFHDDTQAWISSEKTHYRQSEKSWVNYEVSHIHLSKYSELWPTNGFWCHCTQGGQHIATDPPCYVPSSFIHENHIEVGLAAECWQPAFIQYIYYADCLSSTRCLYCRPQNLIFFAGKVPMFYWSSSHVTKQVRSTRYVTN